MTTFPDEDEAEIDPTDDDPSDDGPPDDDPPDDGPSADVKMEEPTLRAFECPNGHLSIPHHPVCPICGESQTSTIDLSDDRATIVTWTTSTATPPGVRSPNHVAIVEFEVNGRTVRTIGQLTDGNVSIGTVVEPVYVAELRDPDAGIRHPDSQSWDGYRFDPVE